MLSTQLVSAHHHHYHHVPEGLGVVSCSLILKMKLVPPSLPRSSYVSSSSWFILQCLFWQSVCVHPLYMLQPPFLVLFYFLYYVLCCSFLPNTLILFFIQFCYSKKVSQKLLVSVISLICKIIWPQRVTFRPLV